MRRHVASPNLLVHSGTRRHTPILPSHAPLKCAGDLQWQLYDVLRNRNEWWVPGKLVELRQRLEGYWRVSNPTPSLPCFLESVIIAICACFIVMLKFYSM